VAHQVADPFARAPLALVSQLVLDPWGAVGPLGLVVDRDDLGGQFGIALGKARSGVGPVGLVGGTGDLQQLTSRLVKVSV
jgi:hypothetical protein